MNSEQLERIKVLNAEGKTSREIASETGVSQPTVVRWVAKMNQDVNQTSDSVNQASDSLPVVNHPDEVYIPLYPTPRELLDLKELGLLGPNARLGPDGKVEDSDGPVVWPAWEPTGEKIVGLSKQTTNLMRPLRPQPARRGTP